MDITAIYWIIGDTSHTKQFTSVTGKSKQFEPLGLNSQTCSSRQSLTHFPFFLLLTELNGVHYLAPVVQKVDSAIQRIHLYPAESAIGFPKTYPLQVDRKWTCLKIPPWFRVHFRAGGLCQSKDANYYEIGSIIVIIMTITKFSNLIGYQLS